MLPALVLLFLLATCSGSEYYFESLTYNVESSTRGTSYACSLQFVSLEKNLESIELTIPYDLEDITVQPVVFLGKRQVTPEISEEEGETDLYIELDGMKIGELETLSLQYSTEEGVELEAGARVEVRTFGLGGDVTTHAINLKLPRGFTISRIETPDGVLRSGSSGIPLDLGREPVVLFFVLRRTNILDNTYVSLGILLGAVAAVIGGILYVLYRKKLILAGGDKGLDGAGTGQGPRQNA